MFVWYITEWKKIWDGNAGEKWGVFLFLSKDYRQEDGSEYCWFSIINKKWDKHRYFPAGCAWRQLGSGTRENGLCCWGTEIY